MGWYIDTLPDQRKNFIDRLVKGWENNGVKCECIAHCYRGAIWAGVVWAVFEKTFLNGRKDRFIVCWMIKCYNKCWGEKNIPHNEFLSCPQSYLDMVPANPPSMGAEDWEISRYDREMQWRRDVLAYSVRNRVPFKLKVGQRVKIREGYRLNGVSLSEVMITSVKPLRGSVGYSIVRLSRKHIGALLHDAPVLAG